MNENRLSHDIDIDNISNLARLNMSPEEKQEILQHLENVLTYCDKLSSIDVTGVEASAHSFPLYDVLREDEPGNVLAPEVAIGNAPQKRDDQIIVPKVVE